MRQEVQAKVQRRCCSHHDWIVDPTTVVVKLTHEPGYITMIECAMMCIDVYYMCIYIYMCILYNDMIWKLSCRD